MMKRIEKSIRDTGEPCKENCNGTIVETFSRKYPKNKTIICGGRNPTPSVVSSDGFGCNKCGHPYGEPIFSATKPTQQIEFELTLSKGTLARKITIDDLPLETKYRKGKKVTFPVGNHEKIEGREIIEKIVKPKMIPPALKMLKKGVALFIIPSEGHDPRNKFSTIQLSIKKGSKTFKIRHSCIS
jgi:hypothetical protein